MDLKPGIYLTDGRTTKAITAFGDWNLNGNTQSVEELAGSVAYLYACYRTRSDKLTGIPRTITNSAGDEVDEGDLPFDIDINDILWRIEFSLNLYGAAYLFKESNGARGSLTKIDQVRWFDPTTITPEIDRVNGLYRFKRQLATDSYYYPVQTDGVSPFIVYVWLPGMREASPGIASGGVMRTTSEVLRSIDKFSDKFFDQGAMPITLLKIPANTRDAERDRLENWFNRMATGITNAFKPLAVRSNVEVERLGAVPSDMAMVELSENKRNEILAATGVPISLVMGTSVNFATAKQEAINFIENVMQPRAEFIAAQLNKQLFGLFDLKLKFQPGQLPVMKRDEVEASAALLNLVKGGMTTEAAAYFLGYKEDDLPADLDMFVRFELPPALPAPPGAPGPGPSANGDKPQPVTIAAASADMKRWRKKARRGLQRNGSAAVPFESNHISQEDYKIIASKLEDAKTSKLVDSAFATKVTITPNGASENRLPEASLEITEHDIMQSMRMWDKIFPDFAGMLDAEVEES